jgi:hypothetical protein
MLFRSAGQLTSPRKDWSRSQQSQQMKSPLPRALLSISGARLTFYGLRFRRITLLRRQPGVIALRDDPLGIVR